MIEKNLGEASILIELKGNRIFVYHGTDKVLLFSKDSEEKTWDNIWEAIKTQ